MRISFFLTLMLFTSSLNAEVFRFSPMLWTEIAAMLGAAETQDNRLVFDWDLAKSQADQLHIKLRTEDGEFADTVDVVFAVKPRGKEIQSAVVLPFYHQTDGEYFSETPFTQTEWWLENEQALFDGHLVLERVDGVAAVNAELWFGDQPLRSHPPPLTQEEQAEKMGISVEELKQLTEKLRSSLHQRN